MKIKDLSMSFGNKELFKDVNLIINRNEKVGIVGVNGAGKTTFFNLILGRLQPESGKIIIDNNERIGFLPQVLSDEVNISDMTVFEYLLSGRPIESLNKELEECYTLVSTITEEKEQNKILNRISVIQKKLDYWDVYNAESTLLRIIEGMHIDETLLDKKLNEISGGQKSKIAFTRLLYSKCELLLLDEPTNHMDKQTKDYITNYLKNYNGSVYVISHDVEFLDAICTKILFLDKRTKSFELFNGNYSNFKVKSEEREKNLINQYEIQQREEEKLREIVLLYSNSSGKRKRMAQDREKKLAKLMENKIELPTHNKTAKVEMNINVESATMPIKVNNISFKYPNSEKYIIKNLSFALYKGEKFLIVGENGIGKSTLLKLIVGVLEPESGFIDINSKTNIGYYAQEHELLDNNKTILENFQNNGLSERQIRSVLGRFLFFGDDVNKKISILSPGERSRVALAKLSMSGANVIILDEPTNHLDPETQDIIADTFKDYKGTMLIVSHNTGFVNKLGIDRTLKLPTGEINYYDESLVKFYEEINNKKE